MYKYLILLCLMLPLLAFSAITEKERETLRAKSLKHCLTHGKTLGILFLVDQKKAIAICRDNSKTIITLEKEEK